MKKVKKRIISAALSSIILAENLSFVSAKTPFSIYENGSSSESDSSYENDNDSNDELPPSTAFYSCPMPANSETGLQNLPPSIPSLKIINNETYYVPQQLLNTEYENNVPCPTESPNNVCEVTNCSPIIQPQFVNMNPFARKRESLKLEISEQELLENLSSSCSPQSVTGEPNLKLDLDSISPLPVSMPVTEPVKDFKSSPESFKPAKNQDETIKSFPYNSSIKRMSPNPLSLEIISTYKRNEEDLNFDQSFNYISNYIFDKSFPTLQELYSSSSLDSIKNFFINSRNQSILSPVKLACSKYIENSNLPENKKGILQQFMSLCAALDGTSENVCILILVYAQIMKATDPVSDPMLSKSLRIISTSVLKKLKETDNLKIKDRKLFYTMADNLKQIESYKKVYVSLFRSIMDNIARGSIGIEALYGEVKLNKYLGLICNIKK